MNCSYHPSVETSLTCSKCMKPICPKCMVQTPVGARCPDCARVSKLPTFHVPVSYYFRAAGAAFVTAILFGIAWGFVEMFIRFFSLTLIMAPLAGWVLGEVTSMAVNRKRGKGLAVIAGLAVVIAFAVTLFFPGAFRFSLFNVLYNLVALGLGIYVTVNRMR